MGSVGSTEEVALLAVELLVNGTEIVGWDNHVAVKYYDVVAVGIVHAEVATVAGTAVFLVIVTQRQQVLVSVAYLVASLVGAVLHYDDLEIAKDLMSQTFK